MPGILQRLDELEEKVDACLILLQKATTHDDFVYNLSDKSESWIKAMQAADSLASDAAAVSVGPHRDKQLAEIQRSRRRA